MEVVKAGLLHVHIKKDGLVEHPIAMIVAAELYIKVVCSRLVKIYGHNLARIEMVVFQLFGMIAKGPLTTRPSPFQVDGDVIDAKGGG
jgi:hypothetical protein